MQSNCYVCKPHILPLTSVKISNDPTLFKITVLKSNIWRHYEMRHASHLGYKVRETQNEQLQKISIWKKFLVTAWNWI